MNQKEQIGAAFEALSASLTSIEEHIPDIAADTKVTRSSVEELSREVGALVGLVRNLIEAEKHFHAEERAFRKDAIDALNSRLVRVETSLRGN